MDLYTLEHIMLHALLSGDCPIPIFADAYEECGLDEDIGRLIRAEQNSVSSVAVMTKVAIDKKRGISYRRKIIRIDAKDSPNIKAGEDVIPQLLTNAEYTHRMATWDSVRIEIGLRGRFWDEVIDEREAETEQVMRFATHKDFVAKHLRWTFQLRMVSRPTTSPIMLMMFGEKIGVLESSYVCIAELGDVKLCVVAAEPAAAWMELCDQVEAVERSGA